MAYRSSNTNGVLTIILFPFLFPVKSIAGIVRNYREWKTSTARLKHNEKFMHGWPRIWGFLLLLYLLLGLHTVVSG